MRPWRGGGFGLSYAAMNGTDTRSELGARFDDLTAFNAMPLIVRGKVAWAHDFVSNPALNASFESLPGTSFTVFGAPIPHDSTLTTVSAQLFFAQNWSVLVKFDGEFSSASQTYGGTGTLRYTWRNKNISALGDIAYWPISEVAARLIEVRSMGHSGLHLLKLSSSHFDPEWTKQNVEPLT